MKRIITNFMTVIILGNFVIANIAYGAFSDVPNGIAYYYAINWMTKQNVVEGYDDGLFHPDKCVNRAEFLKILFATLYGPNYDYSKVNKSIFKDTDPSAWYSPYLNLAVSRQIVQGYPDGTFKPGQCVSRAEAVKMAITASSPSPITPETASTLTPQFTNVYKDVDQDQWYAPYINFAAAKEILGQSHITTRNYKSFQPGGDMLRGEVVEMLYRLAIVINNDAIAYNHSVSDRFEVGTKSTWNYSPEALQDQTRHIDLHAIGNQIEEYFSIYGKYPDAPPGGSCLDTLSDQEVIFDTIPVDPDGKGIGGCANSYMYCKQNSGFMLASYMNRREDGFGLLSNFDNLTICDGSGYYSGGSAPLTSPGPWALSIHF